MSGKKRVTTIIHTTLFVACSVAFWLATSIPSGFGFPQIAMFAGPGMVLALAGSWASHSTSPHEWTWRHGRRAALVGAVMFPPFVALYFAWAGSLGAEVLVALLVLSTWLTLGVGFAIALTRFVVRPKVRPPVVHEIKNDVEDVPADHRLRLVR